MHFQLHGGVIIAAVPSGFRVTAQQTSNNHRNCTKIKLSCCRPEMHYLESTAYDHRENCSSTNFLRKCPVTASERLSVGFFIWFLGHWLENLINLRITESVSGTWTTKEKSDHSRNSTTEQDTCTNARPLRGCFVVKGVASSPFFLFTPAVIVRTEKGLKREPELSLRLGNWARDLNVPVLGRKKNAAFRPSYTGKKNSRDLMNRQHLAVFCRLSGAHKTSFSDVAPLSTTSSRFSFSRLWDL